ncbi:MAG: CDP-diacylglycerol--glycerol-3-phosphate 3-phosphatidyltransferase [Oscillospiraceae bacterium]|nr:CDP-diacylglycerol--glycerol-3-phosphate 3-phosphatidyltransferase [Oscillospiraceae bacterium]
MNTANKITLFRVILIPLFVLVCYQEFAAANLIAAAIFVLASLSDFLDGYIARNYDQVTDFGKFLDPIADKLLVTSAMCIFVEQGRMPSWVLLIVIAREFAVSALRLIAVDNGRVIAAGWSGKVKTACTMVGIIVMLVLDQWWQVDGLVNLVILITTVYSGIEYFLKNKDVINTNK